MKNISYQKCLEEMYGLGRFGIKLEMETIEGILGNLGSPEKKFKSIHIAGTNGKGSIASYIASILCTLGFKTGLYTSPHLIKFNERFVINNCEASDNDIVEAYLAVKNADKGERKATFFELATAMAFYLFGREEVDWAVIETGMGGRLDATNVLKPEVSVISNLSIEHTLYLGDTIEKIAMEKGGIIKDGTPVVSGVSQTAALTVLKEIADKKSAPFYLYGKDFTIDTYRVKVLNDKTGHLADVAEQYDEIYFNYNGINHNWTGLKTGLKGHHQIENSAIALAALDVVLSDAGMNDSSYKDDNECCAANNRWNSNQLEENIRKGLLKTKWPGRLEYIMENPLVIIDGAHNLHAAENLGEYLKNEIGNRRLTMVIGILDDKPYVDMLQYIIPCAEKIIFTKADIERSLDPVVLKKSAEDITNAEMNIIDNVAEAVDAAILGSSNSDAVCIAGSLYVAGEARKRIQEKYLR